MDFKKKGKRLLGVFLALIMAIPVIAFVPTATADAAPAFDGFAENRHRVTVNGLTATVAEWNPTDDVVGALGARTMSVNLSGSALPLPNARYIIYARAGAAQPTSNVVEADTGFSLNQTRDGGLITNFATGTSGTVQLTFPDAGFANSNVRLYIGIVTNGGSYASGGFIHDGPVGSNPAVSRANILTINGLSLEASHAITGTSGSTLEFSLTGEAGLRGFYSVWFTQDSSAWGGTDAGAPTMPGEPTLGVGPWGAAQQSVQRFEINRGDNVNRQGAWPQAMLRPTNTVIRVEFSPLPAQAPQAPAVNDFFYTINYGAETLSFGNNFTVHSLPAVTAAGLPVVDGAGQPTIDDARGYLTGVMRNEISFIFNRRADRINPNRGNWILTMTGTSDISRHLARGGFIGVRRRLPNGQHEMIAVIPIAARPANRDLRVHRRDMYRPSYLSAAGVVTREYFHNPYTQPVEIRVGGDRGIFSAARPELATEFLMPGHDNRFYFNHDQIPRGTRATMRIAPQEAINFVWDADGTYWFIRNLYATGASYGFVYDENADRVQVDLAEAMAAGGNFGSALVRFNIPNQPAAPAAARMVMTPGRNGAPWFISRTNQNMQVRVGTDVATGNAIWAPLSANISLVAFNALFDDPAHELPPVTNMNVDGVPVGHRFFEVRNMRVGRNVSAPGFISLVSDDFTANQAIAASVAPVVISGEQGNDAATTANPLNRNGINVVVTTTGGLLNVPATTISAANRSDVAHWFVGGLPAGLTATVTRRQGANTTITIHGVPTVAAVDVPLNIVIPAAYHEGSDDIVVVNAIPDGQTLPGARFNIAAGAVSGPACATCNDDGSCCTDCMASPTAACGDITCPVCIWWFGCTVCSNDGTCCTNCGHIDATCPIPACPHCGANTGYVPSIPDFDFYVPASGDVADAPVYVPVVDAYAY